MVKVARDLTKMHKGPELITKILQKLEGEIDKMAFDELAMVMWVLAKNKTRETRFVLKVSERVCHILQGKVEWGKRGKDQQEAKKSEHVKEIETELTKAKEKINIKEVE